MQECVQRHGQSVHGRTHKKVLHNSASAQTVTAIRFFFSGAPLFPQCKFSLVNICRQILTSENLHWGKSGAPEKKNLIAVTVCALALLCSTFLCVRPCTDCPCLCTHSCMHCSHSLSLSHAHSHPRLHSSPSH